MHSAIGYQLATAQIAGHRRQAGNALGSCGARYTLTISAIDLTTATQAWPAQACQQAFDPGHGWALSGSGPDHQCRRTFPVTVPRGPGSPLADHVLRCAACLVSRGAQIVSIAHSEPFVLV